MSTWLIFILGASVAGFVQGLTGFAFALIAMSFWIWISPPQLSAPLVVFASLWCHIISLRNEQKYDFSIPLIAPYIVAGLIGVPLGTYLLDIVRADIFKIILGVFLIVWCPIMYFAPEITRLNNPGKFTDVGIGLCGGILGGLGGFCGAIPSAWLMLKNLPKVQQRYILRHFNFAIQLFTLLIYLWKGTIQYAHLPYLVIILFAVSLPAMLGAHYFYKISEQLFKQIVLSLLFASGCVVVIAQIL